jgi:threonine aldolase
VVDKIIDMRSDTVTLPTDSMRRAMAEAEVGDDVHREDPTVNRLQDMAAEMFGKEAAVLVASGTQGNACSMLAQTRPGELAFCDSNAHVSRHEAGGYAALAGVSLEKLDGERGVIDGEMVEQAIMPYNEHLADPALIWVENTSNAGGGTATSPEVMRGLREVADRHGLNIHVDGARIFNAATKLGVPVADIAEQADTVQFCLSKGLGAPVGSLVVVDRDLCEVVRKKRKMLGGGWRQAGVFAAAGIVALTEVAPRLAEDHENARRLADGIAEIPGLTIDPADVETNLVFFGYDAALVDPARFVLELAERGVLIGGASKANVSRACLHHQVTSHDVDAVLMTMREVAGAPVPA